MNEEKTKSAGEWKPHEMDFWVIGGVTSGMLPMYEIGAMYPEESRAQEAAKKLLDDGVYTEVHVTHNVIKY